VDHGVFINLLKKGQASAFSWQSISLFGDSTRLFKFKRVGFGSWIDGREIIKLVDAAPLKESWRKTN
jgi:hypothetical protein